MWKLRMGVLVTSGVLGLVLASGAWAATGADRNSGDVWLDNVKTSTDPGHEMDPHLACQDIALWGSGLADGSGPYAIDGWSPSGSQEPVYQGTWSYTQSGDRVMATIDVSALIAQAKAKGAAGSAQGFHFKLDFSQDPQKHKTFWVDCPATLSDGGSPTPPGGGAGTPGGSTTTGDPSLPTVTTTSNGPEKTSIGAVRIARKGMGRPLHRFRRHRKPLHPARHHRVRPRHVRAAHRTDPSFAG